MNNLDPNEATTFLKDLLKVGKTSNSDKSESSSGNEKAAGSSGANLLQQLFATAAVCSGNAASEQILDLREHQEGVAIPFNKRDIRIDSRLDKSDYLNSKVKIKNIVDLGWENRFSHGNQIAEHCCREYVAYTLKMASGGGGVRIMNKRTNDRVLVKGIQGHVADLAFAHIKNEILLAIVDDLGNLYVYQVGEDGGISYFPLFQVNRTGERSDPNRVIWCKYIPDDFELTDDQDNYSKLLMVSNKNRAEFYYVDLILSKYGQGVKFDEGDIKIGCDTILTAFTDNVTEGSIAPEATTAALASSTGVTKFIKLNMAHDVDKRQLAVIHEWSPHQKSISSLFFLDDHKYIDPDARFWEYVVTGADENRELKLWDCATWTCRQTIQFDVPGNVSNVCLKAQMDLSSNYMILSDLCNNILYVIQIRKEVQNGTTVSASFASIAYFHLTFPVVSFTVSSVSRCKYKPMEEHVLNILERDVDGESGEDESKKLEGVLVELLWLTTKSLQQCSIIYRPLKDQESLTSNLPLPNLTSTRLDCSTKQNNRGRSESDTSSPSKEVADILQQTESEENGNTSPEILVAPVVIDLAQAAEKLKEQTQYTAPPTTQPDRKSLPYTPIAPILNVEELTRELSVDLTRSLTNEVHKSILPAVQTSIGKIGEDCKLAYLTEARQTTRDAVNQVICPTFERISQKLFLDIANNMQTGFKQMLEKVETHFDSRTKERNDLSKRQLEQVLETAVGTMVNHMNKTVDYTVQQSMAACKDIVAKTVASEMGKHEKMMKNSIREEVAKVLAEQRRAFADSPAASLGSVDSHKNSLVIQDIRILLSQGDYKSAFSKALSISDLDVLMQTLRMADKKSMFERNKCPLTPQVLVALIQQLSADMGAQTQLKLEYLEDAMITLDTRDEVTRQLLIRILPSFTQSLSAFLRAHPQHPDSKRVERLKSMAELYTERVRGSGY